MASTSDYKQKENYILPYNLEWREGHINKLTFKENQHLMKGKVLYLGCNNGTSICILSRYCDELIGLDINEKALEEAEKLIGRERISNIKLVNANICDTPFEDNYFDGIYALQILEHIYPEDISKVLKEIKRILKPQGTFIAEFPTATSQYYEDPCHVFFFENKEKIKKVFNKFFKIETIYHETRSNPARLNELHDDWRVTLRNA